LVENYYNRLRSKAADQMKRLYYERDASFRGFRQS
jgi:hypothetical protein